MHAQVEPLDSQFDTMSPHGRQLFVPLILAAKPLIGPAIILLIVLLVCCCCYMRRARRAAGRSWRRRFGSSEDDTIAAPATSSRWSWFRSAPAAAPSSARAPATHLSATGQLARDRLMARVGRGPGMSQELIPPPAPAPSAAAATSTSSTSSWRAWATGAWSRVEEPEPQQPAGASPVWPPPAHPPV